MKLIADWCFLLMKRPQAALALFLSGYGVGYFLWFGNLVHFGRFATKNLIESGHQATLVGFGVFVGGTFLLSGLLLSRRGRFSGENGMLRLAKLLAPGIVFILLPFLIHPTPARDNPMEFLVVLAAFGLGLERTLRWSFEGMGLENILTWREAWGRRFPGLLRWLPILILLAAFLGGAAFLSYHAVSQHYRLQTAGFDLGIFDNLMWNLLRGEWFKATPETGLQGNHFQVHANFIAYLFAPIYAFSQRAETLLILQAVVVMAGVFPLYLLGPDCWAALLWPCFPPWDTCCFPRHWALCSMIFIFLPSPLFSSS